jgi:hypothetical protein
MGRRVPKEEQVLGHLARPGGREKAQDAGGWLRDFARLRTGKDFFEVAGRQVDDLEERTRSSSRGRAGGWEASAAPLWGLRPQPPSAFDPSPRRRLSSLAVMPTPNEFLVPVLGSLRSRLE